MRSEFRQRLEEVFQNARALDGRARESYVASIDALEPALGAELKSLLEAHRRAAEEWSTPRDHALDDWFDRGAPTSE